MSKVKIVVYQDDNVILKKECNAYLLTADGGEAGFHCSIVAQSQKNMQNLVASCMASVFGILIQKGATQEDIDAFFKKAIDAMSRAKQEHYQEVNFNEPLQ